MTLRKSANIEEDRDLSFEFFTGFQVPTEAQLDATGDKGLEFWGGEGSERRGCKPERRICPM